MNFDGAGHSIGNYSAVDALKVLTELFLNNKTTLA